MRLRNRYLALLAAVPLAVGLAACGDDEGGAAGEGLTDLQLGTGSSGGVYFPLGGEYANIFEDNVESVDLTVNSVESGASAENLAKINRGEFQLGLAQNDTAHEANEGGGEFDENSMDNVGFMGQLYPEALMVVTLESTGIESVAELEGKRVAVGPPGGGTTRLAKELLAAYGIEEGDYEPLEEGFADAKAKLQDGNADASIEVMGVPGASLQELHATTGEAKLLSLDQDVIQELVADEVFLEYEIDAGVYDFTDEPVTTISVFACMFGSTVDVSEEVGYEITKSMYENADQLTLPQKDLITIDDAMLGAEGLPLHPGAERYFEEQGLLDQ